MNTKKLFFLFCCLLLTELQLAAQELTVPSQMRFADVELNIEPSTRNRIQNRVNQLMGNWTAYRELSERHQLYSPLIVQALREESVPDDLQYLAVQLSGLSADATSPRMPGGAGFWLMPADIAKENNLQVDNSIDERKNLLLSTRAFARAMQKNNYSLRNWVYAAVAYHVGLSNAFGMIDRSRIGINQLEVNTNTPDVIIELLAYTFVFRDQPNSVTSPVQLLVYNETQGKTLEAIAKAANLPLEQLRYYNSWLLGKTVPSGRNLPVYLPVPPERVAAISAALKIDTGQGFAATAPRLGNENFISNNPYPVITNRTDRRIGNKDYTFATVNNIAGMVAADGQSIDDLAAAAGISKNRLIKINDFTDPNAELGAGQVIYLKPKHNKGPVKEHLALPGESFWSVAQMYGMTLKSLLQLNRIGKNEALQPGRVLSLQTRVAKNAQPEYRELPAINPAVVQNAPALQVDNTIIDPNADAAAKGVHIVQPGESIYDIAKKYGITITDLRRWNGITGFSLTSGMELKIRGEAAPAQPVEVAAADTFANAPADSSQVTPPTSDIDVMPAGQVQAQQPTYTVKAGDNIYSIAMQHGIKLEDLRRWNNLQMTSIIKPGDVLKLYDPAANLIATRGPQQLNVVSASSEVVRHKVQRGETLTRIAARYNTTVANLRAWNNLQTDALAINQELIVSNPSGVNAAAANTTTGTTVVNIMPQNNTAPPAVSTTGTHTVVFGESVEDITNRYNISTDDFYRWNTNISIGATALIPGSTVFVADPATAGGNAVNITPQPAARPAVTNVNVNLPPAVSVAPSTAVPQAIAAPAASGNYTVQAGETLFGIARKFNIPVTDLMRWNNMDMNTKLQLGQTITLQAPAGTASVGIGTGSTMLSNISDPTTAVSRGDVGIQASSVNPAAVAQEARIYTTVPGDNIYDLANRFGVRLNDFRQWNNIPAGVFTLPVGTPVAINEAAAAQVAAMKAQATQQSAKGIIAETANPAKSGNTQVTLLPKAAKGSVIYHVVSRGETLFSIARKYKVKVSQIKAWNNMKTDRINAGTRLIVSQ